MKKYDPNQPVDPEAWLAMDEDKRIRLVEDYHRRKRIEAPDLTVHALFQTLVENQVALGDEIPVRKTLHRLMEEGLSRHDALHAIGCVLSARIWEHQRDRRQWDDEAYHRQLEELTPEKWHEEFGQEE